MEILKIIVVELWNFFIQPFDILGYQISFFQILVVSVALGIFAYLMERLS